MSFMFAASAGHRRREPAAPTQQGPHRPLELPTAHRHACSGPRQRQEGRKQEGPRSTDLSAMEPR